MNDATVAPACFHSSFGLTLDDRDVVTRFHQVPSGCRSDGSGAKYDRRHLSPLMSNRLSPPELTSRFSMVRPWYASSFWYVELRWRFRMKSTSLLARARSGQRRPAPLV